MPARVEVIRALEEILLGNFISRFSVGDTWSFSVGNYWLLAQSLSSPDESQLNELLFELYKPANYTVDKEYISRCTIVAANLRKEIIGVALDATHNLSLIFEKGSTLVLPATTDIVDWQWCLNTTGNDPYSDYLIACFGEGTTHISKDKT